MSTATQPKTQPKVQIRTLKDPLTGFESHTFRYRGRYYSLDFRNVKDKFSYQLWEEYVSDDGSLAGAGEFYTSHLCFSNQQAALKDAAMTIKEMEEHIWPDDIDPEYEAMIDSY